MMGWKNTLQQRLGVVQDGQIGPITLARLFYKMGAVQDRADALGKAAASCFPSAGILDNSLRLAHFMAQAAHETGGFRYLKEIWGPTTAQIRYEGRADLGNHVPGDGKRYLGRGIFQITGRANYAAAGKAIGVDLIDDPDMAAAPDIAVMTACDYWISHRLSSLADRDDIETITRRINGGSNGLPERKAYLAKMKGLLA